VSHQDSEAYRARSARKLARDELVIAHWIAEVMASADADHPPCRLCISGAAHRLALSPGQRSLFAYVAEAVDMVVMASHDDPFGRSEAEAARYRRGSYHTDRCTECDGDDHTAPRCPVLAAPRQEAA
jgi:hypothetical protein